MQPVIFPDLKTVLNIIINIIINHNHLEEVPLKWMDRPSAKEMDRQTKCHKNENATEMDKT